MTKTEYYLLLLIKTLLKCYGLWPHQSEIGRKFIFVIHHLCTLSVMFALIGGLTEEWSTRVNVIYENIVCITYFAGAAIKYTILYLRRNQIKPLCDQFLSDYHQGRALHQKTNAEEQKLLNAYISKGLRIMKIFLVYGFPTYCLVNSLTLYWRSEDFVEANYEKYFPYYYHKMIFNDRYYYPIIVLHLTIAFISTSCCYFTSCALFVMLTTHACGVFTIAHHRLKSVMDFPDGNIRKLNFAARYKQKVISNLVNVVNKHNEAIQNVQQIERTFSLVIGTVQLAALVCFGVSMYDVICHTGTIKKLMRSILLLSIFIFYVYILNWTGQKVLDVCNALFMSCYTIKWDDMPLAAQKSLIVIQKRASKCETLTAAFIFILSLDNFSWVLQNSWAITAVLLSTHNKMNIKQKYDMQQ